LKGLALKQFSPVCSHLLRSNLEEQHGPGPKGHVDLVLFQGVKTPCSLVCPRFTSVTLFQEAKTPAPSYILD
jgi:hypothetical protein